MFEKLTSIDFHKLRSINFQSQKWNDEFWKYFSTMEKILNIYLDLEKFENILSNVDKNIIKTDIVLFLYILSNVWNKWWKDPNNQKFKKEKFNQSYINWLNARKWIYEHTDNLLNSKDEDYSKKISNLEEEKDIIIQKKDESIEAIKWEKEKLNKDIQAQKETIQKQKKEIEEKQAQINDQALNKLAKAFWEEETKYQEWSKKMIYFGFVILLIPTCITIYILVQDISDYILSIPFWVLTIILWYFQYFQLKNYYINRDLQTNFANRKAVANSFRWLLEMVNEEESFNADPDLKTNFFEKVSSILYSKIDTSYIKKHNDDVPTSKFLDTLNELIKKLK